jgi:hypothetical protein
MIWHVVVADWPMEHCADDKLNVIYGMHGQVKGAQNRLSRQGWKQGLSDENLRHRIATRSFASS